MRSVSRRSSRRGHRRIERSVSAAWRPEALSGQWSQLIDFGALLLLFAVCALGGGSSFAEVPSLLYVRPVAVACLLLFALTPARADWRTFRAPLLLLAALAALMLLQLVPLPPAVWTALPGRTPYVGVAALAGFEQPWRPLSLAPDLTANALAALIVPGAVLVGMTKLRDDQRVAMVVVLVMLCFVSALLGIAQFAGGKDSPLYLYQRTYPGFPVGLVSNRNHQAALLSILFPALRAWTLMPTTSRSWQTSRQWLALGLGIFTVPVVLATGSRAGMALMIVGIVAAFVLFPLPRGREQSQAAGRQRVWLGLGLTAAAALLILTTYLMGRAASIERLLTLSSESDQRFQFAPTVLRVARETFPAGTGFGTFDPVFRQYEPDAILISSYFNHAHNELLELTIMAGLPGLLLLLAFAIWWTTRAIGAVRIDVGGDHTEAGSGARAVRAARLGGCATLFLLLASLVDYPLRPPLMSAVFALGCAWLCIVRNDGGNGHLKGSAL